MAGSSLMRGLFEPFISNANKTIAIKLIATENDLKEENAGNNDSKNESNVDSIKEFNPEFCHQMFGDNEQIFGYKDLKIRLYYSVAKLNCYLKMDFTEKLTKDETNGIEADNVLKTIADKLELQFCQTIEEFRSLLSKEFQFKPYGQLIEKLCIEDIEDKMENIEKKRQFEIYLADISSPGFEAYHERMQTFLWWFIDAASYIDVDDEKWHYFVIYEKKYLNPKQSNGLNSAKSEDFLYCFVGYATIYRYYAYPDRMRPRISQFLILPPFQKCGIGSRLLEAVYNNYKNDTKVFDITVEDPSDNFTRIRDFVDSRNCQKLKAFSEENLKLGFSKEMSNEAQKHLKISQKQSRRVYEILRYRNTNRSNPEEYKAFRLEVKQRLNAPLQKQIMDYNKIAKLKKFPEQELAIIRQTTIPPLEIRVEQLDKHYKELEDEYQRIIERLAIS